MKVSVLVKDLGHNLLVSCTINFGIKKWIKSPERIGASTLEKDSTGSKFQDFSC